jgi:hypothetical protein
MSALILIRSMMARCPTVDSTFYRWLRPEPLYPKRSHSSELLSVNSFKTNLRNRSEVTPERRGNLLKSA